MTPDTAQMTAFLRSAKTDDPKTTAATIEAWGTSRPEIVIALVRSLRPTAAPVEIPRPVLDCCGTGGSGLPRLNTGTLSAFVAAALGTRVVKFGGRAATGRFGSVNLMEHLGFANVFGSLAAAGRLVTETRLAFLAASSCYPELAAVAPARAILGKRTVFNLAGPLLNPALPELQLLGVPKIERSYIEVLDELGIRAWIVTSASGLDEGVPGDTILVASAKAPAVPDAAEIREASGLAMSSLGAFPPNELFRSRTPAEDAMALLEGSGRADFITLVAWNAALLIRMIEPLPLHELYTRSFEAIRSGVVTRFFRIFKARAAALGGA